MVSQEDTATPRRFLRFTLRSLLLTTSLFCLGLGWKVEQARKQQEAVRWVERMGGEVMYEYELDGEKAHLPAPKCLIDLAGIDFFSAVVSAHFNDEMQVSDLSPLSGLTGLERLVLSGTPVRDVSQLAGMTRLKTLLLNGTMVSDASPLAELTNLETLNLDGTRLRSVAPLSRLSGLRTLSLSGIDLEVMDVTPLSRLTGLRSLSLLHTPVIDLTPLRSLTNLRSLRVVGTWATHEDYELLRKSLPYCQVD